MRMGRRGVAGIVVGGLVLAMSAAPASAQEETAGTARTTLTGAELQVTDLLGESATATLMDLATLATTDGTPFASTSIIPVNLDGQTAGETGASSDGETEAGNDGAGLGELTGLLGIAVQPVSTSANATADSAVATIDALTAQLGALSGVLDLDLASSGIVSAVSPDGSSAAQGLTVSGLDLSLADLGLGADVLGQLGLDQVLALLGALDLEGLPEGAVDSLDEVLALQGDLEDALAGLDPLATSIDDAVSQLTAIDGRLADITDLTGYLETLLAADSLLDLTAELLGILDGLGCDVTIDLAALVTCVEDLLLAERDALIAEGVEGLDGVAAGDLLTTLEGLVDGLLGSLDADVTELDGLVITITDLVDQLVDALGGLDAILDLLPDLLSDAAGLPLVGVDAFDVGFTAVAADTLEDSSATVLCQPVDVTILGEVLATPDCSDGLSAVADVTGAISDALGGVTDVLNTLPLDGVVEVGDLRADLFTNLVETVEEADGVITATAGFNLLDLQVPSVTLDPSAVTDQLGLVELPDVLGPIQGIVDSLAALDGLTAITDPVLAEVIATVDGIESTIGTDGVLAGLVDEALTLIDGLLTGDLGTLTEGLSTPALSLLIDPVSTATFTASAVDPTDPTDPTDPAPEPEDEDPTLPTTGGGLALLGVLTLAGAAGLRRRR